MALQILSKHAVSLRLLSGVAPLPPSTGLPQTGTLPKELSWALRNDKLVLIMPTHVATSYFRFFICFIFPNSTVKMVNAMK